jgi:hypothetical protein
LTTTGSAIKGSRKNKQKQVFSKTNKNKQEIFMGGRAFYSFDNMVKDLNDDLQIVTQTFFDKNQLHTDNRGENWQDQMTTPLSDVARELLMFGANDWPLGGHENVVRIAPTGFKRPSEDQLPDDAIS